MAEVYFRKFNTSFRPSESEKLKASLRDYGIGIDCSGFVAWVLNEVTQQRLSKPIWKCLQFPGARRRAVSQFRPLENISASLLTGDRNTNRIATIGDVLPGDMVRALHGGHVIVVAEVGTDKAGKVLYFRYFHSTAGNEQWNGVCSGLVVIRRPDEGLIDQEWMEGMFKIAPALAKIKEGGKDSRIVRLKALC